jgi:parallel beta-helix repeat protein
MKLRAVLLVAAIWALAVASASATVYVKWDAAGTPDGASWDTAYHTVAQGLNAASSGQEVWVAAGTYVEKVILKSGVKLYGGYSGIGSSHDPLANVTVLDGNHSGSVVTAPTGATTATVIDGFTIRNGSGTIDAGGSASGGGVYAVSASPTISNNVITSNAATATHGWGTGGGIFLRTSNAVVTGNTISYNTVTGTEGDGGGICSFSSGSTISGNTISRNMANTGVYAGHGTGIYSCGGSDQITNNRIIDNTFIGSMIGGGINCSDPTSAVVISGNTITGNTGSGVYCRSGSPLISNNTISNNLSVPASYVFACGIECQSGSNPTITGNTISSNSSYGILLSVSESYEQCNSVISGNTITGNGGGISCSTDQWGGSLASNMSPLITSNTISSNTGGGISANRAVLTVRGNIIDSNGSTVSGAVSVSSGSAEITNNTFTGNRGGVSVSGSSTNTATISGNTFSGNKIYAAISVAGLAATVVRNTITDGNSVGISCGGGSGIVANNLIARNTTSNSQLNMGGGIRCSNSAITIANNTLVDNTSDWDGILYAYGAQIVANNIVCFNNRGVQFGGGQPDLRNNCVYGNSVYNYRSITPGSTDLSLDPILMNRTTGDYHLGLGSPCVNAGFTFISGLPTTDLAGNPRVVGGAIDVGAYEYGPARTTIATAKNSGDGTPVEISTPIVSAAFPDFVYLETTDRTSGIRANKVGHPLKLTDKAYISGVMRTNTDGERYIDVATWVVYPNSTAITPLLFTNKATGGGNASYDPVTGAGQRGVEDGSGVNNIGLLAKVTGKVTAVGPDFFYIDDGTHAHDASILIGVRVLCGSLSKPASGQYVNVTGISTMTQLHGRYFRAVRPRIDTDTQTVSH